MKIFFVQLKMEISIIDYSEFINSINDYILITYGLIPRCFEFQTRTFFNTAIEYKTTASDDSNCLVSYDCPKFNKQSRLHCHQSEFIFCSEPEVIAVDFIYRTIFSKERYTLIKTLKLWLPAVAQLYIKFNIVDNIIITDLYPSFFGDYFYDLNKTKEEDDEFLKYFTNNKQIQSLIQQDQHQQQQLQQSHEQLQQCNNSNQRTIKYYFVSFFDIDSVITNNNNNNKKLCVCFFDQNKKYQQINKKKLKVDEENIFIDNKNIKKVIDGKENSSEKKNIILPDTPQHQQQQPIESSKQVEIFAVCPIHKEVFSFEEQVLINNELKVFLTSSTSSNEKKVDTNKKQQVEIVQNNKNKFENCSCETTTTTIPKRKSREEIKKVVDDDENQLLDFVLIDNYIVTNKKTNFSVHIKMARGRGRPRRSSRSRRSRSRSRSRSASPKPRGGRRRRSRSRSSY